MNDTLPEWLMILMPIVYGVVFVSMLLVLLGDYISASLEILKHLPRTQSKDAIRYVARRQAALLAVVILFMAVFVWLKLTPLSEIAVFGIMSPIMGFLTRFSMGVKNVRKKVIGPRLITLRNEPTQELEDLKRKNTDPPS